MYGFSYENIFNIRQKNVNKSTNPILHHLSGCFEKFLLKYGTVKENFREMWLFENPIFKLDNRNQNYLNINFFSEEEFNQYGIAIKNLKMSDILNPDNTIKTKPQFEFQTGIIISEIKYTKLRDLTSVTKLLQS